ncbi:MAG: hypothetical protein BalsKO_04220 [Balneolaceae bacterium]
MRQNLPIKQILNYYSTSWKKNKIVKQSGHIFEDIKELIQEEKKQDFAQSEAQIKKKNAVSGVDLSLRRPEV